MDWTTTTCMAMGYLFFCNFCVCKCNNTVLSDSRTPNTHKLLYKSFWWHTHPWFNASHLPSELQPKNWKPNHTQISKQHSKCPNLQDKASSPSHFLVPHNFFMHLCLDSNLVGSAIESCTYLHPPNVGMNLLLDYCGEYYHTNIYNTCLCGHKS
jgi:hypothetical protein